MVVIQRQTQTLRTVLQALMADPDAVHYGYDLSRTTKIRSGVMYPTLQRLLDAGWVGDGWEDPTTIQKRRAPRRYYRLTELGKEKAAEILGVSSGTKHATPEDAT